MAASSIDGVNDSSTYSTQTERPANTSNENLHADFGYSENNVCPGGTEWDRLLK